MNRALAIALVLCLVFSFSAVTAASVLASDGPGNAPDEAPPELIDPPEGPADLELPPANPPFDAPPFDVDNGPELGESGGWMK